MGPSPASRGAAQVMAPGVGAAASGLPGARMPEDEDTESCGHGPTGGRPACLRRATCWPHTGV